MIFPASPSASRIWRSPSADSRFPVDVHPDGDTDVVHRMLEVLDDAPERRPPVHVRPHSIVDLGRPVEADLRARHPTVPQFTAGLLVEQPAVGRDVGGIRNVRPIAALDEGGGKGKKGALAHQRLATEPGDSEVPDVRKRIVQHVEDRLLYSLPQDRRVLRLEAVGAVEVASEAGDDREAEVGPVVATELVTGLQQLQFVGASPTSIRPRVSCSSSPGEDPLPSPATKLRTSPTSSCDIRSTAPLTPLKT